MNWTAQRYVVGCGGDRVLRETVFALIAMLRQTDIASRMGGEEFVVLPPVTGLAEGFRSRGAGGARVRSVLGGEFGLWGGLSATGRVRRPTFGTRGWRGMRQQQGRNRMVAAKVERS